MKQPGILREFSSSLKNPWAEELSDLFLFRPVAFIVVKLFLYPLPITPNQVSFLAMASGIASGILFTGGDRLHFFLGAVFYGMANVLDCCDGMIARLKKNGTLTGRIVDGCIDYIIGIAVYGGFAMGLHKAVHSCGLQLPCNAWLLMILAGISFIAHAVMSDKFRNAFLVQTQRPNESCENEFEKFKKELVQLERQKGHLFDKTLIRLYLRYLQLQSGRLNRTNDPQLSTKPQKTSATMVVLWNLIGPSTHVLFMTLSAFFYNPIFFFIYVIGAANLWMIALFLTSRLFISEK
jgi:hypothetical protein